MIDRVGVRVVLAATLGGGLLGSCGGGSSDSPQHNIACGALAQEAVYNGTGDVNVAASYTCRVP
jgi:hypothetical protein